jgi:23S rRNA (uracil1939-C5)-methyltransferase
VKHKSYPIVNVKLDKIVGGGQAIGTLEDGCKIFVWGGLPGETVNVQITKKKSKLAEGFVKEVIVPSAERIEPLDKDSYLSTSPWQIMNFESEQRYKSALIEEAYELHDIVLPAAIEIYSDDKQFGYRNKIEFSWWWDNTAKQLDLAFFKRASHTKTPVLGSSLALPAINKSAIAIRDLLREKNTSAYSLKTLLIRCDQDGNVAAQLYVKDENFAPLTQDEIEKLHIQGFEIIFSNPKSPASVVTKRLLSWGTTSLNDKILGVDFNYVVEGFFQINIPVYVQALTDMKEWVIPNKPTVDLYSGVGTIGLTIGGENVTMVEINEHAYQEMERNILNLKRMETIKAILAPSELALDNINSESTIIVDPPRAGLHEHVINKLLETKPARIIYLSCNPVTQARDVASLAEKYGIRSHKGYNFFPRTPHIEHLVILDLKAK